jgi:hypothetical protein
MCFPSHQIGLIAIASIIDTKINGVSLVPLSIRRQQAGKVRAVRAGASVLAVRRALANGGFCDVGNSTIDSNRSSYPKAADLHFE